MLNPFLVTGGPKVYDTVSPRMIVVVLISATSPALDVRVGTDSFGTCTNALDRVPRSTSTATVPGAPRFAAAAFAAGACATALRGDRDPPGFSGRSSAPRAIFCSISRDTSWSLTNRSGVVGCADAYFMPVGFSCARRRQRFATFAIGRPARARTYMLA